MSYVIISWKVDHFSRVPFFNCTFVIANDIENLGGIFNLGYSTAYFEGIWNTTVCSFWISTKKSQSKDYHSINGGPKSEHFEIPQIRAHNSNVSKTDILKSKVPSMRRIESYPCKPTLEVFLRGLSLGHH